jgi:hypothetical protein
METPRGFRRWNTVRHNPFRVDETSQTLVSQGGRFATTLGCPVKALRAKFCGSRPIQTRVPL